MANWDRFKPLLATGIFALLFFCGTGFYVSIIVLIITVVATHVCFTLNTQLRLEKIIKYIIKYSFKEIALDAATSEDGFQRKHNRFKTLPLPFQKIAQKYVNSIINDFIKTWYINIGPNEKDFIKEVRDALEYISIEIYLQLRKVDAENVIINLIRMFQRHLKVFDDCRTIVQNKYSGINEEDLCNCITELYEVHNIRHIATNSKGAEIDYLKALLDIILYRFLPEQAFSCEGGRFMLREILTNTLLEPLVKDLTDAYFVNQAVVELLEPSTPLPIILKQWQKVIDDGTLLDSLSFDEGEVSSVETEYSSDTEDAKCKHCHNEQSLPLEVTNKVPRKASKYSQKDLNKLQKLPKKTVPKKTDKKLKEIEKSYPNKKDTGFQYDKEPFRFDKLDLRTSAPVYGSVSVRDHENRNRMKGNRSNIIDKMKGGLSDSEYSHDKSMGDSFQTYNSFPTKEPHWPSSWAVCPPANASIFRQSSFQEMPRVQDDMTERMKARLNHLDLHGLKPMNWIGNVLPGQVQGPQMHELMATDLHNVLLSSGKDESYDYEDSSSQVTNSYAPVEVMTEVNHDCKMEGDDSCTLCIEMTLMASPFEIDKEKVLFDPRKSFMEHDCGLNYKHFYYAETESATSSGVPADDQFFASCEDIITEPLDFSCSPPNYINVDKSEFDAINKKDHFVLSNSLSNSEYTSDDSNSYDEIDHFISDEELRSSKENLDSPSVVTFRTARDNSSSNNLNEESQNTDHNKSQNLVKGRKYVKSRFKKSNNKFLNFFKGFNTLSRKRRLLSQTGISKLSDDGIYVNNSSRYKGGPSSFASTTQTKFISLPDNSSSSLPVNLTRDHNDISELVEEVASEAIEDDDFFEHFPIQLEDGSVDPLSNEIAVNPKPVHAGSRSSKSSKSHKSSKKSSGSLPEKSNRSKDKEETSVLQMYGGEVIKPHPSKIPAAWFYPVQMVSIPGTESAVEKGWERGMNKYTLYNIHYDIRIWPDVYQRHVAATMHSSTEESTPLIREIKRRYREFIYLHNRFTHGPLSKYMKGILRPNRRYALPFGRMDPDVIEGRRRILETYLVSLVSRIELCNSREFKEFLGSENHEDVVVVKPTIIAQKQMCNSQMGKVIKVSNGTIVPGQKEHKDSQYFIHGYDVQRMFGYADNMEDQANVLQHFIDNYEEIQRKLKSANFQITVPEPIQVPYTYTNDMREMRDIALQSRTAGDGAEAKDLVAMELSKELSAVSTKKHEESSSFSVIAAKFSPELASHLEKENLELKIAREKDLYESSWPLTDAVLSIVCQALKGYGSWLCFERVQQAILFSLGGVVEWLIKRELVEFLMKERWYKYFCDLYSIVWKDDGTLKEKKPDPTKEERERMKKQALTSLMEIIPRVVMMSIGPNNYHKGCENLLHTLQYPVVNRHLLFAALEIILFDLVPELRNGYPEYTSAFQSKPNITTTSNVASGSSSGGGGVTQNTM